MQILQNLTNKKNLVNINIFKFENNIKRDIYKDSYRQIKIFKGIINIVLKEENQILTVHIIVLVLNNITIIDKKKV